MKKRLKINGIIMGCAAMLVVIFPRFFFRQNTFDSQYQYLEILGFALILLGQIIRVSARGYKAENSCDSQALIQGGPYQIVRNPMYLGIFLIGLGVVLVVFKWWAVIIFVLVFLIRYLTLIFQEEKKLLGFFPQSYPQYCKNVPRIFPQLKSLIKLDISQYLPLKISWFQKEIGSIFTLLLIVLAAEFWGEIFRGNLHVFFKQLPSLIITFVLFLIFIMILSKRTQEQNENRTNKS